MHNNEGKKFISDIAWVLMANISIVGVAFIQRMSIARFMGPEELGAYALILSIYAIGTVFIGIGIPMAIIKYVAEFKDDRTKLNELITSALVMTGIMGLLAGIIMFFITDIVANLLHILAFCSEVRWLALIFPFSSLFFIVLAILNGKRQMRYYSILQSTQNILFLALSILFLIIGWRLKSILIALLISVVVVTVFSFIQNRLSFSLLKVQKKIIPATKTLLKFGSKVFITDLVNQVNIYADFLILGFFLEPKIVGFYTAAISISRLIVMIPVGVQKITFPAASEYWARNDNLNLNKMVNHTIKYASVITIILGVGIIFFAREIIRIIFGAGFESAMIPMIILILGIVLQGALIQSLGGLLSAIGRPELSLKVDSMTVAFNMGLNFALIPVIGLLGAALAKTISLIGNTVVKIILFARVGHLKIQLKPFYLILCTAIPLFLVKWLVFAFTEALMPNILLFLVYLVVVSVIYFSVYTDDIKLIKGLLKIN